MNSSIRIAIIIPVFNAESYIKDCLESILAQTYTNWTAYVVDDGSVDSTSIIVEEYKKKDSRIVVFHKNNGGVASARNFALDRLGDEQWISFVDADDYISPDMYTGIIQSLSNSSNYNIDYIRLFPQKTNKRYSDALEWEDIVINENKERVVSAIDYFKYEDVGGFVASLFVKSSIIQTNRVRFVESMKTLEDQVFSIECAARSNSIMIYKNDCYYYYSNPKSATNASVDSSDNIIQCINIVESTMRNLDNNGLTFYFHERFMPRTVRSLLNERIRHIDLKPKYKLFDTFNIQNYKMSISDNFKFYFLKLLNRI